METLKSIEIENEKVYLKKDFFGWRTIEPLKNPETGEWILKNLWSKKGLAMLVFVIVILSLFYLAFQEQINNYKKVMENPCSFCKDCFVRTNTLTNNKYPLSLGGED